MEIPATRDGPYVLRFHIDGKIDLFIPTVEVYLHHYRHFTTKQEALKGAQAACKVEINRYPRNREGRRFWQEKLALVTQELEALQE